MKKLFAINNRRRRVHCRTGECQDDVLWPVREVQEPRGRTDKGWLGYQRYMRPETAAVHADGRLEQQTRSTVSGRAAIANSGSLFRGRLDWRTRHVAAAHAAGGGTRINVIGHARAGVTVAPVVELLI
jgi:hypothetical protein